MMKPEMVFRKRARPFSLSEVENGRAFLPCEIVFQRHEGLILSSDLHPES